MAGDGVYRCATSEGESLTEDQRRLNARVVEHMAQFSRIVYAAVNDRFPRWRMGREEPE
jgi:hypothetical protein